MEQRAGLDHVALLHERDAALADNVVEVLDRLEVRVDQRLIDELPQMLGRLQLGTVRGLVHEPDTVGHAEVFRAVPAGVVDLDDGAPLLAGTDRLGKVGEDPLEIRFADVVRDVPHRAAGGRLDKAMNVEPFVAMVAERNRTLAFRRPHAARDRLQADPMLVHRPGFDRRARALSFLLSDGPLKFFLTWLDPHPWPLRGGAVVASGSNIRCRRAHPSRADRARI